MNQEENQSIHAIENRFADAMNDEILEVDIMKFRQTFEDAWQKRRWYHRLATKPLFVLLSTIVLFSSVLGAGYSLVHSDARANESALASPILMPGQQVVNQPELLSLFPKVERPTVISMKTKSHQSKQTYLVHGYMAENNVQVVWEY